MGKPHTPAADEAIVTRRSALRTGAILVATGVAGCLGDLEPLVRDTERDPNDFGETIEHGGIEAAPTAWTTADELTYHTRQGVAVTQTPPSDTTLLLTYFYARNRSESQRILPSRSTDPGSDSSDIVVVYDGEEAATGRLEDRAESFETDGTELTPYDHGTAAGPDGPGERQAEGWVVNTVPTPVATEKIRLAVTLRPPGSSPNTVTWLYDDAAELPLEEAATKDEDTGSVTL